MTHRSNSGPFATAAILVLAAAAAIALGAWQNSTLHSVRTESVHSAFVESGGVATDADGVNPEARVAGHDRANVTAAAVSTL